MNALSDLNHLNSLIEGESLSVNPAGLDMLLCELDNYQDNIYFDSKMDD